MIKPVQFSGWATPIAPVIKGVAVSEFVEFTNSHTAKWETKFEVYPLLKIDDFVSCQAVRLFQNGLHECIYTNRYPKLRIPIEVFVTISTYVEDK